MTFSLAMVWGCWWHNFSGPIGSEVGAADDNQTTIPTTNERTSRDWEREPQRHEGGDEPTDGAQIFGGWPGAGGTSGPA